MTSLPSYLAHKDSGVSWLVAIPAHWAQIPGRACYREKKLLNTGVIVVSLIRQLSRTRFLALLPLKQPLQREFYAEMHRIERWSGAIFRDQPATANRAGEQFDSGNGVPQINSCGPNASIAWKRRNASLH